MQSLDTFTFQYTNARFGSSLIFHADGLEWLSRIPENSIHSIVTDPPYGVKEYNFDQIEKKMMVMEVFGEYHPLYRPGWAGVAGQELAGA